MEHVRRRLTLFVRRAHAKRVQKDEYFCSWDACKMLAKLGICCFSCPAKNCMKNWAKMLIKSPGNVDLLRVANLRCNFWRSTRIETTHSLRH